MTVAMILSAGLGTRLRPLTDEVPKPLVPVGDLPAVAHIQRVLSAGGIHRHVINTHHRADAFSAAALPAGTTLVHEPTMLGTAGGVANARTHLGNGPVVVWNGDILAHLDVRALLERALGSSDLDAVWIVAPRPRGEGTVGLDAAGDVVRVRAFRRGEEVAGGDFLGVSALSARVVAALPPSGCLVGDVLGPALERGARIGTVLHEGAWDDLGSPASYLRASLRWLEERREVRYLGPGAEAPEGTTGIIGAGARVTGAPSRDVVIWPGAIAHDVPPRTIVTPRGLHVTVP